MSSSFLSVPLVRLSLSPCPEKQHHLKNENDNNKNRTYAHIDQRIKNTYIKASTAQKTKLYDMYARFYRWASDRLGDEGIVAFVTNRSFIDSRTFDGFRKLMAKDFTDLWIVDLGGDVRANPKLSGTKHNVFGIQTGVAIAFLIRQKHRKSLSIKYVRRPEMETAEDKLSWLAGANLHEIESRELSPDDAGNWLKDDDDSEWKALLPLASRTNKESANRNPRGAIFKTFSFGLVTNRDDWLYDRDSAVLTAKVSALADAFNAERDRIAHIPKRDRLAAFDDKNMKWTRSAKRALVEGRRADADAGTIIQAMYRPFDKQLLKFDRQWVEMANLMETFFGPNASGNVHSIVFTDPTSQKPFMTLAVDRCADMHLVGAAAGGVVVPFTQNFGGEDNITDWALNKFVAHYGKKGMSKDAIFAYCYAVLHDPVYRETYALNLKREFPRIPFYPDFAQWAAWGEKLMAMHIGYEQVTPFELKRIETPSKRATGTHPKPVLKSNPEAGSIIIDADTQLTDIPAEAWTYRLGNRSAIDWVLDQHKEKKPRDPTIAAKFNTYRFADYKEACIELLARVVTVSLDTVKITNAMKALDRSAWE